MRRASELLLDGAVEGFAEAIGFRRANLSAAMRDLIQRQEKPEKSAAARQFAPAGFAAVLGGQVLGCDLALLLSSSKGSTRS
jgi:hypothetical protein